MCKPLQSIQKKSKFLKVFYMKLCVNLMMFDGVVKIKLIYLSASRRYTFTLMFFLLNSVLLIMIRLETKLNCSR